MGTTVPKKAGTPGEKAALIRDQVAASEVKYVGDWVDALVRSIEALRVPARDDPALHKVRADLDAASGPAVRDAVARALDTVRKGSLKNQ